ncbi:hypothetical protein ASQ50_10435 [Marinobacter sp. LQ44]|nr:hypothetical protein ASQ50_10435 [Marinobacter sp. LQ44]
MGVWPRSGEVFSSGKNNSLRSDIFFPAEKTAPPHGLSARFGKSYFATVLWVALAALFCLPGEAGKPGHLKEDGVTPTEGKTIRLARASLANGGV